MTTKIFIDGEAGTTGLEIRQRLQSCSHDDITFIQIPFEKRKDMQARRQALNAADIAILCLPDAAACESVRLVDNPHTCIIDASTVHRISPDWVYGFPEMTPEQAGIIAQARRIANPGCYPQGVIALLRPLSDAGYLPQDAHLTVHGVSGYSGGGRQMIEAYQQAHPAPFFPYGLTLSHKHLPEMQRYAQLFHPPLFLPAVVNCYRGMMIQIPVHLSVFTRMPSAEDVYEAFRARYAGMPFIRVCPPLQEERLDDLSLTLLNNTNYMNLYVSENKKTQQMLLLAVYDNLGKGASGSLIQCLNLVLQKEQTLGLL